MHNPRLSLRDLYFILWLLLLVVWLTLKADLLFKAGVLTMELTFMVAIDA